MGWNPRRASWLALGALLLGSGAGAADRPDCSMGWVPVPDQQRYVQMRDQDLRGRGCRLPPMDGAGLAGAKAGLLAGWLDGEPVWLGVLGLPKGFEQASEEFLPDPPGKDEAPDPADSAYGRRLPHRHVLIEGDRLFFGVGPGEAFGRPHPPLGGELALRVFSRDGGIRQVVLRLDLPPPGKALERETIPAGIEAVLAEVTRGEWSFSADAEGPAYVAFRVDRPTPAESAPPTTAPVVRERSGLAEALRVIPDPDGGSGDWLVLAKLARRGWFQLEVETRPGVAEVMDAYIPARAVRKLSYRFDHRSSLRDLWLAATRTEAAEAAQALAGPGDDGWSMFRVLYKGESRLDPDQLALVVPGGEAYPEGRDAGEQGGGAFGYAEHKLARRQAVWFYGRTRRPGEDLEIWDMSRGVDGERVATLGFPTKAAPRKDLAGPFERARFLQGERLAARNPGSRILAARAESLRKAAGEGSDEAEPGRGRERPEVDLFSIFSGALAVQESLQLDVDLEVPGGPGGGHQEALKDLAGPELKPIDFDALRGKREPATHPMDAVVPADLIYLHFRDFAAMRAAMETVEAWGGDLLQALSPRGSDARVVETYEARLGLRTGLLGKLFGEQVIGEVGAVAFDPFLRDGTDLAVLLEARNPTLFEIYKAGVFAELQGRGGVRSTRKLSGGGDAVVIASPDGKVRLHQARIGGYEVFAAGPRILDALAAGVGKPQAAMARDPGYRYTRVVQPADPGEAAFLYLSDGFVRRIVGPAFKLAAARRARCAARLGALGNEARFDPAGAAARVAQGGCPSRGRYSLAGTAAACSVHGSLADLRPVSEVGVETVGDEEAEAYREFARRYQSYWRGYMDPIGVRLALEPDLEVRTHVLPLIRSSIYAGMAEVAEVAAVSPPLVPLAARLPDALVSLTVGSRWLTARPRHWHRDEDADLGSELQAQLAGGATFYVHDGDPLFLLHGLEEVAGRELAAGPQAMFALPISAALASIAMPVSLEIPVRDPRATQALLEAAASRASRWYNQGRGLFRIGTDGYRSDGISAFAFDLGPLRFHLLAAVEGDRLLVSTKPAVLERLRDAVRRRTGLPAAVEGARDFRFEVYPGAARQVTPSLGLAWGADMRRACFGNLGDLSGLALADPSAGLPGPEALAAALGQQPLCPQGGSYSFDPRSGEAVCSVHGAPGRARQPPNAGGAGGVAALARLDAVSVALELGAESLDSRVVLKTRR